MKKIIVTGSCGFIGFNLINNLGKNIEVVGVDSLNDAYDSRFKKLRQKKLEKKQNFKFHQIDLSNIDTFKQKFSYF